MIKEEDILRFKKEKIKLDYIRRERFNELLLVHPDERKKDDEYELAELLIDYPCFQYVAEENFEDLLMLSREIYMECLLPDSTIFKQDDDPDCAYLIIQGHASVYVTFTYTKFQKSKVKTKHMCDMGSRTIFGELSLLFKGKRTATVKSLEACYVIIIPRDSFNKFMRQPMLKKLNIIISFYRSLNFMDGLDNNTLLIIASKTSTTTLQSNTLVVRQDNKSKYLYFIKKGRVKILRNIEIIDHSNKEITVENYKMLFKEPEEFHRKKSMVKFLLLELTELGQYECFGEDSEVLSSTVITPYDISQRQLPYSVISSQPLECYCIGKTDFYEYISDVTRKQFLKYLRTYPTDKELRRFYFEQTNWMQFRNFFVKDRVVTPPQIKRDQRRMQEIQDEDRLQKRKQSEIILPKINKRAQNRQRIMGWNKMKQQAQLEKAGIGGTSRNKSMENGYGTSPIDLLAQMSNMKKDSHNKTMNGL
eukprot:403374282